MTRIDRNVAAQFASISKDKLIDEKEVASLTPALIKDLIRNTDSKATLESAAKNLKEFLAPFAGSRTAPGRDVEFESMPAKYKLHDLADMLTRAGDQLASIDGGMFQLAMGLSVDDGKLSSSEIKDLQKVAAKMVKDSADPKATAAKLKQVLVEFDAQIRNMTSAGMGSRDEVMDPAAQAAMGKLNAFLGASIAKHSTGVNPSVVDPNGPFAKGLQDALRDNSSFGPAAGLAMVLPSLIESELGVFDTKGLSGPAKLKMDAMRDERAGALMAHVNSLNLDDSGMTASIYRMLTGHFVPPNLANEFKTELKSMSVDDLKSQLESFEKHAARSPASDTVADRNNLAALKEGAALVAAELKTRA